MQQRVCLEAHCRNCTSSSAEAEVTSCEVCEHPKLGDPSLYLSEPADSKSMRLSDGGLGSCQVSDRSMFPFHLAVGERQTVELVRLSYQNLGHQAGANTFLHGIPHKTPYLHIGDRLPMICCLQLRIIAPQTQIRKVNGALLFAMTKGP